MSIEPFSLYWPMRAPISFAARAVYATIVAVTYECQHPGVTARMVRQLLELSEEAWAAARDELLEHSLIRPHDDPSYAHEIVEASEVFEILAHAGTYTGRPSASAWAELHEVVTAEQGTICAYCSKPANPVTLDHIVPLSKGGSNNPLNMLVACRSCNSSKGARSWDEWMGVLKARGLR
jgi:5-methylcytosine-specific restriction endonuclease McrA